MDLESLRVYCLSKKGVTESLPFDEDVLVFKVMSKMFLLTNLRLCESFNVKCDPERAVELRDLHEEVMPGYHMSKKHWNTVLIGGRLTDDFLIELIDHSYDLVVKSMTKKEQKALETLE